MNTSAILFIFHGTAPISAVLWIVTLSIAMFLVHRLARRGIASPRITFPWYQCRDGKVLRRGIPRPPSLLLLALLGPCTAHAIGLGDIKSDSYINQPLDAEISVLPMDLGGLQEAGIAMAPAVVFDKAGIARPSVLNDIKFKLVKDAKGLPSISVTSTEPIKEPLLDFIVQVTWLGGELQREYVVLLDPPPAITPEAAPTAQPPVANAGGETAGATQAAAQPQTVAAAPVIATRSIEPKLTHDSYGPTMRPDTLWGIAKEMEQAAPGSIQQVMLALVKKNPEAFYDSNVNALKAGYVLRIPDKDLINQVSEADALQEVKREYHRWMQDRKHEQPPAGTTGDDSPASGQTEGGTRNITAATTTLGASGDARPSSGAAVARIRTVQGEVNPGDDVFQAD
jgi:pilus assembly protein FimV